MARVNTNNTSLRFCTESSIGTAATSGWRIAEFNSVGAYGAEITTVARRPISADRGRKKGTVTDLDSTAEFETDLTVDAFTDFAEGFVFSRFANQEFNLRSSNLPPPAASSSAYTIDAAIALLAGKVQWVTSERATLVYARGYTNAGNNGLKPITADTATSGTSLTVGSGLTAETPPTTATLEVAGVRVLNDADLTLTITVISGIATATLVSATSIAASSGSWASLGLRVGMFIHIGGVDTTTGAVQNGLGTAGTQSYGFARITAITTSQLTLDKLSSTLGTAGSYVGPVGASQDVLFGRFLRNVPVGSNSDDNIYLDRTYQMEVTYDELGGTGTDEYEYSVGNYVNEMSLNVPLAEKATINYAMIGTNTQPVTASRKTGPSTALSPARTTAFSTSSNVASLTTDLISSASDVCFKSLTLTLTNNVSPEKCIGTLGATFMNSGLFEVNLEGQMLFTSKSITNAIRNNTTVTFAMILDNQDGAIAFDMPELTLSGGGREFPVDQSVLVNITGNSYTSSTYGYDVGISVFPVAPWA
jgi:hypothetical protein